MFMYYYCYVCSALFILFHFVVVAVYKCIVSYHIPPGCNANCRCGFCLHLSNGDMARKPECPPITTPSFTAIFKYIIRKVTNSFCGLLTKLLSSYIQAQTPQISLIQYVSSGLCELCSVYTGLANLSVCSRQRY